MIEDWVAVGTCSSKSNSGKVVGGEGGGRMHQCSASFDKILAKFEKRKKMSCSKVSEECSAGATAATAATAATQELLMAKLMRLQPTPFHCSHWTF